MRLIGSILVKDAPDNPVVSAPTTNPLSTSNAFNFQTIFKYHTKIYVPDASVNAYKTATNWNAHADYIYPLSTRP